MTDTKLEMLNQKKVRIKNFEGLNQLKEDKDWFKKMLLIELKVIALFKILFQNTGNKIQKCATKVKMKDTKI